MAYTRVPTVAVGDLWTAANHNAYIKNNFAAGVPDIFTAKGDLAVARAADFANVLPIGSNDNLLLSLASDTVGVVWGLPSSGLFNFGHWTSTAWAPYTILSNATGEIDIVNDFGVPSGARILLTFVDAQITGGLNSTRYNEHLVVGSADDAQFWGQIEINGGQFTGDTDARVSQTGICLADTAGILGVRAQNNGFLTTIEFWGWAL